MIEIRMGETAKNQGHLRVSRTARMAIFKWVGSKTTRLTLDPDPVPTMVEVRIKKTASYLPATVPKHCEYSPVDCAEPLVVESGSSSDYERDPDPAQISGTAPAPQHHGYGPVQARGQEDSPRGFEQSPSLCVASRPGITSRTPTHSTAVTLPPRIKYTYTLQPEGQ